MCGFAVKFLRVWGFCFWIAWDLCPVWYGAAARGLRLRLGDQGSPNDMNYYTQILDLKSCSLSHKPKSFNSLKRFMSVLGAKKDGAVGGASFRSLDLHIEFGRVVKAIWTMSGSCSMHRGLGYSTIVP